MSLETRILSAFNTAHIPVLTVQALSNIVREPARQVFGLDHVAYRCSDGMLDALADLEQNGHIVCQRRRGHITEVMTRVALTEQRPLSEREAAKELKRVERRAKTQHNLELRQAALDVKRLAKHHIRQAKLAILRSQMKPRRTSAPDLTSAVNRALDET
jgi:hypothetical protein